MGEWPHRDTRTIRVEAWLFPMESAPKDGSEILAWCRHSTWAYCTADDKKHWEGFVVARWTEFNGGGWTWHGHCGEFLGWYPFQDAVLRDFASLRETGGATA